MDVGFFVISALKSHLSLGDVFWARPLLRGYKREIVILTRLLLLLNLLSRWLTDLLLLAIVRYLVLRPPLILLFLMVSLRELALRSSVGLVEVDDVALLVQSVLYLEFLLLDILLSLVEPVYHEACNIS